MQRIQFRRAAVTLLACAGAWSMAVAQAQERFPSKPLRIIVTFGAGGSGDLIARAVAPPMGAALGQTVTVENRPGGNALPGTDHAARAPADGYTILQYTTTLAVNMVLQPNVPYDLFRDFAPVALVAEAPLVLLTPGTSSHRSVAELIAYAKSRKEGVSFGHGGSGSMSHLSSELFKRAAGISAVSVPYKGNAPAMNDLIGGRLDYYFSTVSDMVPHIRSGRLHALAVTSPQRDPLLPNVPTMLELGYRDFTPAVSWGFLVPRATPAPVVAQLQEAIAKAIASPALQDTLKSVGATSPSPGHADAMTARMRSDIARWEPVIRAANIQPD